MEYYPTTKSANSGYSGDEPLQYRRKDAFSPQANIVIRALSSIGAMFLSPGSESLGFEYSPAL